MAQIKANNEVITPIDTQDANVYRLRLGTLKFYNSNATLLASSERGFSFGVGYKNPIIQQLAGYGKWSFNNNVFTTSDIANNTIRGIQNGDVIEITTTGTTPVTYTYFIRVLDGQIADSRDGGRRLRLFVDKNSTEVVNASNPAPATIADGTEFIFNIRRWDAPRTNASRTVTSRGVRDASTIEVLNLGRVAYDTTLSDFGSTATKKFNTTLGDLSVNSNPLPLYISNSTATLSQLQRAQVGDRIEILEAERATTTTIPNQAVRQTTLNLGTVSYDTSTGDFSSTSTKKFNLGLGALSVNATPTPIHFSNNTATLSQLQALQANDEVEITQIANATNTVSSTTSTTPLGTIAYDTSTGDFTTTSTRKFNVALGALSVNANTLPLRLSNSAITPSAIGRFEAGDDVELTEVERATTTTTTRNVTRFRTLYTFNNVAFANSTSIITLTSRRFGLDTELTQGSVSITGDRSMYFSRSYFTLSVYNALRAGDVVEFRRPGSSTVVGRFYIDRKISGDTSNSNRIRLLADVDDNRTIYFASRPSQDTAYNITISGTRTQPETTTTTTLTPVQNPRTFKYRIGSITQSTRTMNLNRSTQTIINDSTPIPTGIPDQSTFSVLVRHTRPRTRMSTVFDFGTIAYDTSAGDFGTTSTRKFNLGLGALSTSSTPLPLHFSNNNATLAQLQTLRANDEVELTEVATASQQTTPGVTTTSTVLNLGTVAFDTSTSDFTTTSTSKFNVALGSLSQSGSTLPLRFSNNAATSTQISGLRNNDVVEITQVATATNTPATTRETPNVIASIDAVTRDNSESNFYFNRSIYFDTSLYTFDAEVSNTHQPDIVISAQSIGTRTRGRFFSAQAGDKVTVTQGSRTFVFYLARTPHLRGSGREIELHIPISLTATDYARSTFIDAQAIYGVGRLDDVPLGLTFNVSISRGSTTTTIPGTTTLTPVQNPTTYRYVISSGTGSTRTMNLSRSSTAISSSTPIPTGTTDNSTFSIRVRRTTTQSVIRTVLTQVQNPQTYKYVVRTSGTPIAQNRSGGGRTLFLDRSSTAIINRSNPIPTGRTDGSTFAVRVRRVVSELTTTLTPVANPVTYRYIVRSTGTPIAENRAGGGRTLYLDRSTQAIINRSTPVPTGVADNSTFNIQVKRNVITSTTRTTLQAIPNPRLFRYLIRATGTPIAEDRVGGGRTLYLDRSTQTNINLSSALQAGITDGSTFDIRIRRGTRGTIRDSVVNTKDNQVQVWTKSDGFIDESFIDRHNLGIEETFTIDEKTKLDLLQDGAEVNVQRDYGENNSTQDDYMENKPLNDALNMYWRLIPDNTTFRNTTYNTWTQLQNSNIHLLDFEGGGYPFRDPRKLAFDVAAVGDTPANTIRNQILEAGATVPSEYQAVGFNGEVISGIDGAPDLFRLINPKFMLFMSWGNFIELVPVSLYQWIILKASTNGGVIGNTPGTDYLHISNGTSDLRIGRTDNYDMLVSATQYLTYDDTATFRTRLEDIFTGNAPKFSISSSLVGGNFTRSSTTGSIYLNKNTGNILAFHSRGAIKGGDVIELLSTGTTPVLYRYIISSVSEATNYIIIHIDRSTQAIIDASNALQSPPRDTSEYMISIKDGSTNLNTDIPISIYYQ